jgi:hypothetical protein
MATTTPKARSCGCPAWIKCAGPAISWCRPGRLAAWRRWCSRLAACWRSRPLAARATGAAAVPADAPGQRLPVNGQMAGGCSAGGVSRRGWLRSRKSVSALAAASRRVSAGRFHFSSMVARIEVWS